MNVTAFEEYARDVLETALMHKNMTSSLWDPQFMVCLVGNGYGGNIQATNTMVTTLYNKYKETNEKIFKEAEKNLVRNIKRYSHSNPIDRNGFIGTVEEFNKYYQRYGYSMKIPDRVET